jgi:cell division protein FtsB
MATARVSAPAAPARRGSSRRQPARANASRGSSAPGPSAFAVGPLARVRWDRLARLALLGVLVALLYLYVSAGVRLFSTWREARSDSAQVQTLEREHVALLHRHETLGHRGTVEEEARRLGMMKPDEQPYVITGLPNN